VRCSISPCEGNPATDGTGLRIPKQDVLSGINRNIICSYFVVEVGPRGSASVSNLCDEIAPPDLLTNLHMDLMEMAIPRDDSITVVDGEDLPVSILPSHFDHQAIGRSNDGSSNCVGDVYTLMHLDRPREECRPVAPACLQARLRDAGGLPVLFGPPLIIFPNHLSSVG